MTESEWLDSTAPHPMTGFVGAKATSRKATLYSCACLRVVWPLLTDERDRFAVAVAEHAADGPAVAAGFESLAGSGQGAFAGLVSAAHRSGSIPLTDRAALDAVAESLRDADRQALLAGYNEALRRLCGVVSDLFGNPFRPVAFDPSWRTPTAVAVALRMYDAREFDAMPVLADALQDAGCEVPAVLDHCRRPAEHFLGCWVVDLVLGKK